MTLPIQPSLLHHPSRGPQLSLPHYASIINLIHLCLISNSLVQPLLPQYAYFTTLLHLCLLFNSPCLATPLVQPPLPQYAYFTTLIHYTPFPTVFVSLRFLYDLPCLTIPLAQHFPSLLTLTLPPPPNNNNQRARLQPSHILHAIIFRPDTTPLHSNFTPHGEQRTAGTSIGGINFFNSRVLIPPVWNSEFNILPKDKSREFTRERRTIGKYIVGRIDVNVNRQMWI